MIEKKKYLFTKKSNHKNFRESGFTLAFFTTSNSTRCETFVYNIFVILFQTNVNSLLHDCSQTTIWYVQLQCIYFSFVNLRKKRETSSLLREQRACWTNDVIGSIFLPNIREVHNNPAWQLSSSSCCIHTPPSYASKRWQ